MGERVVCACVCVCVWGGGGWGVGTPAGCDTSVQETAERVSAPGVIYLISYPFWEESPGAIAIFTERFRASQLTGQKGKASLCVGDE